MEPSPKDVASQLRKPEGEFGIKIGEFMHKGNAESYKHLMKVFSWKRNTEVLEIGMGSGMHIADLKKQVNFSKYTGLDYSETMLQEAKKNTKNVDDVFFVSSNAADMNVSNNSCDVLFTINTVYFYDDPLEVFNEMYRVLRKGATLIIGKRPKEDLDLLSDITDHGFNKLSGKEVEKIMLKAGFSGIKIVLFDDQEKEFPSG